jgi:hypothetical protein
MANIPQNLPELAAPTTPGTTPRQALAPLQKITPRQKAVAIESAAIEAITEKRQLAEENMVTAVNTELGETIIPVKQDPINSQVGGDSGSGGGSVLPPIATATQAPPSGTIAKGNIIGDQEHLFWRQNLEVHVRVWELQDPVCYAIQIHATDDKRDIGIVYMNKEAVDNALDNNYILSGTKTQPGQQKSQPRFTMQMSDLKDGADNVEVADSARLERHYEEVMKLVLKNLNVTGTEKDHHEVSLVQSGGSASPYKFTSNHTGYNKTKSIKIAARKFDEKLSRAQLIEQFQQVQSTFSAQLDTVKQSTGQANTGLEEVKEIEEATSHMTSPVRLQQILERVRKRSMLKVKAINAFTIPRSTM